MPLLGCPRSGLHSQRRKLRQRAQAARRSWPHAAGDRERADGGTTSPGPDAPPSSTSSQKIQENCCISSGGRPSSLSLPLFIPLAFKPRNFHQKVKCKKEPGLSQREAPSSSHQGLNWLLININPPNQSHAQKTLDEETQGGRGVSNFLLTSSGKLRAPLI